jgi:two-component system, NarL family, response regulator NreC
MGPGILLADDHVLFRQALRVVLEREGFTILAEAHDGQEAVALAQKLSPDVAILDIAMPVLNGLDAGAQILKVAPRAKLILLTMYTDEQYVIGALRAGAHGYVIKTQAAQDLVEAVRSVHRGMTYLSPSVSRTLVDACLGRTRTTGDALTSRERQVLQLVAEGKTSKEIAQVLEVGIKSAETYRARIMQKLEIHTTAGLVRYAIRQGLIQA